MRIVEKSDQRLVIEDRPWPTGLFLAATSLWLLFPVFQGNPAALLKDGGLRAVFAALALFLTAAIAQRVRLTFDRDSGRITRTSWSVLGRRERSWALRRLREARAAGSRDEGLWSDRMELRLVDPLETVPITGYRTSGGGPDRMALAVDAWLRAAAPPASAAADALRKP